MRRFLLGWVILCMVISCYAETPANLGLNTNAFLNEGILPVLYTCDGKNISPQLDWVNIPAQTVTFSLLITDLSVEKGPFYHWILYNIPKTIKELPEAVKPTEMSIGKNSFGKSQYNGPCPPKGSLHTYAITLFAVDKKLELPPGAEGNAVMQAMKKHILAEAGLTLVYNRWMV